MNTASVKGLLRNRGVQFLAGLLLISFAVAQAGVWFFWTAPRMARFEASWEFQFTTQGGWHALQAYILRFGPAHEDGYLIGTFGDKTWAAWIIRKAEAGESINECEAGHVGSSLAWLTCQNPSGTNREATPQEWLAWWATNQEKSQVEWIQAGLAQRGVIVHVPPQDSEVEPLLTLLGNNNTNVPGRVPPSVKYNAYRWLRDSGFDPLNYALTNATAQTSAPIRAGLLKYGKSARTWPKDDGAGLLFLFPGPPNTADPFESPRARKWMSRISTYGPMILPFVVGIWLVVRSRRNREGAPA